ncbi:MAG: hypothetical protein RIF41_04580 [Polyangiaceae bacterium]
MRFVVGRSIVLLGTLRVEGTMCRRLEDAHPVAATTFVERVARAGIEVGRRHDQAARLWLELDGGLRLRLRGPVMVSRGSEERRVGALGLSQLCSKAHERLESASRSFAVATAAAEAVFRSLRAGDPVEATGVVEAARAADAPASYRRPGKGYELVPLPDPEGVLRLVGTGDPKVASLRARRSRSSRQLRRLLGLRL